MPSSQYIYDLYVEYIPEARTICKFNLKYNISSSYAY